PVVAVWVGQESFDFGSIKTLPLQTFGFGETDFADDVRMDIRNLLFTRTIDIGGPYIGRRLVSTDSVRDLAHGFVQFDSTKTPVALRDLLDWRAGARSNTEQMRRSTLLYREVDVFAVGRPAGPIGFKVPFIRQID